MKPLKPREEKKLFSFYIDLDLLKRLAAFAARNNVSKAEVIRYALAWLLEHMEDRDANNSQGGIG